jgi:hypothetical protein
MKKFDVVLVLAFIGLALPHASQAQSGFGIPAFDIPRPTTFIHP